MASMTASTALFFVALMSCSAIARAADPDPLRDFEGNGRLSDFIVRDVFRNGEVSNGSGGLRAALNTSIFPGLTSQGITYVQFKMVPCGVNLPHTHPRATEILTLISGGPLQVGFVDTRGESHINIMYPGDVTVFPRGTMHFEINVGKELAFYISALNSQNPGTLTSGGALLEIPARAAATALNQDLETFERLKNMIFPYTPELRLAPPHVCVPGRDITTKF